MNNSFIIASRVIKQLFKDKRMLGLTVIAPFVIVYFLKLFMDTMPAHFPVERYIMPASGFIVFFLSFILCAIVLVQERVAGTLVRMFISGANKAEIIGGYLMGYLILATIIASIVMIEVLFLFELEYELPVIGQLFAVMWLLSIVSVMLGMLISNFARTEGHVLPFIPMVLLPSVFLSGMIADVELLPIWAQYISKALPLYYANNIILELVEEGGKLINVWENIPILIGYGFALLILASFTLRETD